MTTRYASYLVRCWRAPNGARRVVVEHVQSGARAAATTLDAAMACIVAWEEAPQGPEGHRPGDHDGRDTAGEAPARQV